MVNPLKTWRAKQGFKAFTGHEPKKSQVAKLDGSDVAGYALGDMVGVAYEATRDGQTDQYFHRFKKAARPKLVSRDDGKQLYIAGGKYKITDRGIEDMPELFIVNPSSRRRKAKASKAPAKRRVTRKKKATPFMANPIRRRRRRRATSAAPTFRRNPIRRRRRATSFRRNPIRRRAVSARRRGYRRNPTRSLGGKGGFNIMPIVLPSIAVGLGAVGAELLMGYLPIPAMFKTGPMRYLAKAAVSIAAGYAIARFGNRKVGEAFAMGGIAIAAHDAAKAAVTQFMPGAQFGGWDNYGYSTLSDRYGTTPGLGYYSPGQTVGMAEYQSAGSSMGEYTSI